MKKAAIELKAATASHNWAMPVTMESLAVCWLRQENVMTLKYCQTKAKDVLLRNQKTRHPKSSLARKKITGARSTTWVVLPLWSLLALYRCFRGQKVFTVCSTPNFLVLVILFPSKRFQHLNVLSTHSPILCFLDISLGPSF